MASPNKSPAIVHDPRTFVMFSGPASRTRSHDLQVDQADQTTAAAIQAQSGASQTSPTKVLELGSSNENDSQIESSISSLQDNTLPYFLPITPQSTSWRTDSCDTLHHPSVPQLHLAAKVVNELDDQQDVVCDDVRVIRDVVDARDLMTRDYADNVVEYHADCVSLNVSPTTKMMRDDTELRMIHSVHDDDDDDDDGMHFTRQPPRRGASAPPPEKPLITSQPGFSPHHQMDTFLSFQVPHIPLHSPLIPLPVSTQSLHLPIHHLERSFIFQEHMRAPNKLSVERPHLETNCLSTEQSEPPLIMAPMMHALPTLPPPQQLVSASPTPADALPFPHSSPTTTSAALPPPTAVTMASSSLLPHAPRPTKSALFCPSPYVGSEDPTLFMESLNRWLSFNNIIDDQTKISTLSLLLHGPANYWFSSLTLTPSTTFDEVTALFLARFSKHLKVWDSLAALWHSKQGANQSAIDYLNELTAKSKPLKVDSQTLFNIAIHGLKPSVRQAAIIKGVADLDSLIQVAQVIEISAPDEPTSNAQILTALEAMQKQLSSLQGTSIAPVRPNAMDRRVTFQLPGESDGHGISPSGYPSPHSINFPPLDPYHEQSGTINPSAAAITHPVIGAYDESAGYLDHSFDSRNSRPRNSFPRNEESASWSESYHHPTYAPSPLPPRQINYSSRKPNFNKQISSSAPRKATPGGRNGNPSATFFSRTRPALNTNAFTPKFNKPQPSAHNASSSQVLPLCMNCGGIPPPRQCLALGNICAHCHQQNHLSTLCRFRPTFQH